jgi:methylmalonyl-CoA carboxyltransferase large subunit
VRRDVEAPKSLPAPAAALVQAPTEAEEAITPEVLALLSAAVAAFLGKTARIRSARRAPGQGSSQWAQQGRVFVQASHNLDVRRS